MWLAGVANAGRSKQLWSTKKWMKKGPNALSSVSEKLWKRQKNSQCRLFVTHWGEKGGVGEEWRWSGWVDGGGCGGGREMGGQRERERKREKWNELKKRVWSLINSINKDAVQKRSTLNESGKLMIWMTKAVLLNRWLLLVILAP